MAYLKVKKALLFFALRLPLGLAIKAVGAVRRQEYTYRRKSSPKHYKEAETLIKDV